MEIANHRHSIHPLVISSACDHYTTASSRTTETAENEAAATAVVVFGLIFGTENVATGDVNFIEASEAIWERDAANSGCVVVNVAELTKKIRLWTGVYAAYKLVGWYSFGGEAVEEHHIQFMSSLCAALPNEKLYFLKVNPHVDRDAADVLPLVLYSCPSLSSSSNVAEEVPFKVESSPTERITVDTITKSCPPEGLSAIEVHNQEMIRALASFGRHVDVLVAIIEAMQSGIIPMQPDLLRQAKTICQHITSTAPCAAATDTAAALLQQQQGGGGVTAGGGVGGNEEFTTVMFSFLSSVTKNIQSMHAVAGVYQSVFGGAGMRGGGRGSRRGDNDGEMSGIMGMQMDKMIGGYMDSDVDFGNI